MNRIRFYNAKIAQFDGTPHLLDGELWTADDRIAYVGPASDSAAQQAFDREIDCRGNLLLPGFKNAHTHAAMVFLRSSADDLPLQEWLSEQVYPFEAQLTPDDVYKLVRLAVMEMLAGGQTAMFDMYFHLDAAAQAVIDTGFRMALVGATNDFGGSAAETAAEYAKFNALHPRISYRMGIHAEYTTNEKLLDEMIELTRAYKQPFFTHLCETKAEVESCYARYGVSPIEMLEKKNAFEYGGGGFHFVHLCDRDFDIIAGRGLYPVTCPASNLKLASGVAPVNKLLQRGVPVSIGTDGAASNNALDFFREMYLTSCLQKVQAEDAGACDALEVLRMACVNGARAMGQPDCDALSAGKQADLTVIDLHTPNMQPENNVLKNVVYAGGKQNVALTMVAGRILYENGAFFIGAEPEQVYAEANAIIRRMRGQQS